MTFHSSDMRELAGRRLRYSIIASLSLHLLVLWPGVTHVLTKDVSSVLHATLKPSPQTEPAAPVQTPPRAVAPAPISGAPTPRSRPPVARPPVLEQASTDSVPPVTPAAVPPLSPPPAPDTGSAAVAPPSAAAQAGPATATSGALITEANASGEAVDGLRGYRLAVATQARRFKRYPAQAMAAGWAGTVEVRLEVGSDARPRAATVARSSGHEILDRAALTTIDAGALRARLPESLRGKAFAVVFPVVFNLDDE